MRFLTFALFMLATTIASASVPTPLEVAGMTALPVQTQEAAQEHCSPVRKDSVTDQAPVNRKIIAASATYAGSGCETTCCVVIKDKMYCSSSCTCA